MYVIGTGIYMIIYRLFFTYPITSYQSLSDLIIIHILYVYGYMPRLYHMHTYLIVIEIYMRIYHILSGRLCW